MEQKSINKNDWTGNEIEYDFGKTKTGQLTVVLNNKYYNIKSTTSPEIWDLIDEEEGRKVGTVYKYENWYMATDGMLERESNDIDEAAVQLLCNI